MKCLLVNNIYYLYILELIIQKYLLKAYVEVLSDRDTGLAQSVEHERSGS